MLVDGGVVVFVEDGYLGVVYDFESGKVGDVRLNEWGGGCGGVVDVGEGDYGDGGVLWYRGEFEGDFCYYI